MPDHIRHDVARPDDGEGLIRRLVGGDTAACAEILDRVATDGSARLLVAAALLADEPAGLLATARGKAVSTRDRQLVAIAAAHLDGDEDLFDALVRDHLSDHPDNVLAAWIAAKHGGSQTPLPALPVRTEPVPATPVPTRPARSHHA